jgi:sulfotransferase family protein
MLTPILIAGYGRSGTTLLMQILTGAPGVACDRVYPYENRYLTYYAKLAHILAAPSPRPELTALQLIDYDDFHFGAVPWPANREREDQLALAGDELFRLAWRELSARAAGASHYAEKVPAWLPAWVRPRLPSITVHLVRDPRDLYLSAVAFLRGKGLAQGFGRDATSSDIDHAKNLAHALLVYYENERAERERDDVIRVRYEDFVTERTGLVNRLSRMTGLQFPHAAANDDLPRHRTSDSPQASIGRWRRESLPSGVRETLESLLGELLIDNSYDPPSTAPAPSFPLAAQLPHSANRRWSLLDDGSGVEVRGPAAWIQRLDGVFAPESSAEIWACVRGVTGDHCTFYWRGAREAFDNARSVRVPFHPGEHWQIIRFVLGGHPRWHGEVTQVRLDFFRGAIRSGAQGAVRWIRQVK